MKTILVADDDKNFQLLLKTELSLEGYQVILANNGREALRRIKKETPDLLVLDLKMPNMHGLDVLRTIRKENKELPVVICTAYEEMRDDRTVRASHIAGYLTKPIGLNCLKAIMKRSLANKKA
ncbi:MAG: response regulator [Candidatus Aerophobetes bacterium]|nr:response regulator [Candidatus Aerophobetes bacterium]